MAIWYELMDTDTGNMVGEYDTLAQAIETLRGSKSPNLAQWIPSLILSIESEDESISEVIATGQDLVSLCAFPSGRHAAQAAR